MALMKAFRIVLALALCAACTASADTVETRDGMRLKGRVVEETNAHVRVRTPYGVVAVPRSAVRRHARAVYVVELKDGAKVEGEIRGESETELKLRVGGKARAVALAQVVGVAEKKPGSAGTGPAAPGPARPKSAGPKGMTSEQRMAAHLRVMEHFKAKRYDHALAELEKVLAARPGDSMALYNAACAAARLKDAPKAVAYLRKSVEAGWVNFDHITADPDLESIRKEAGYRDLMARRAEFTKKAGARVVARITEELRQHGVDVKRYRSVFDTDRNLVYLHAKSGEDFARVRASIDGYAEHQWAHLFQNRPKEPLYIVLLTRADSARVFRGGIGGFFNADANALFCGDIPSYKLMRTSVVRHEFTHALHFADMRARSQRHPIWLLEGLATLFESSVSEKGRIRPRHSYRLKIVQEAVRRGKTFPWKMMMRLSHRQFMMTAQLGYAQSRYMLFYMHEKGLLKKFYDEYTRKESYAGDKTALESYEVVFGKPIEAVERDWKAWIAKQKAPEVPFLGVSMQPRASRVIVSGVVAESAADRAGLRRGDVIKSLEGTAVKEPADLMEVLGGLEVGEEIDLDIERDGKPVALKATLGKRPDDVSGLRRAPAGAAYLGVAVETADGAVRVREVAKGSPAAKAGLRVGMTILAFDGQKMASVRDYLAALKNTRPGQTVTLRTKDGDAEKTLKIKVEAQGR
jgi:hypothetical protein